MESKGCLIIYGFWCALGKGVVDREVEAYLYYLLYNIIICVESI